MVTLHETLGPESASAWREPTRRHTDVNRFAAPCGTCRETFYIDDRAAREIESTLRFDPSNNPFRCPECGGDLEFEEHP